MTSHTLPSPDVLAQCHFGIERETLRIKADGRIAQTPHPAAWGDKMQNPRITTDFAEAQPEFITPICNSLQSAIDSIVQVQADAAKTLPETESLWAYSMPPLVTDDEIVIAKYAPEHVEKEIYRRGLAVRYGKTIQLICGVHLSFSLGDSLWASIAEQADVPVTQSLKNERYLSAVRQFLRWRWLSVLVFGRSPQDWNSNASLPHATSLRMSRRGYSNSASRTFVVDWNSLDGFIGSLEPVLKNVFPAWEKLGLRDAQGQQQQLNTFQLQSAAEYYSPIRIKPRDTKRPALDALATDGISHVEVRAIDISPDHIGGIDPEALAFSQLILMSGMLRLTPLLHLPEREQINAWQADAALLGHTSATLPYTAAESFLDSLRPLAAKIGPLSMQSLETVQQRLTQKQALPSAPRTELTQALQHSHQQTALLRQL